MKRFHLLTFAIAVLFTFLTCWVQDAQAGRRSRGNCSGGGCSNGNCSATADYSYTATENRTVEIHQSATASATPATAAPSSIADQLLSLHNAERARIGAPPLVLNAVLCQAAQSHSATMARTGRLFHGNLGAASAENCAQGQQSAAAAVNSWMNSKGHRTNLLNPIYRSAGFGMVNGYWTAQFSTATAETAAYLAPTTAALAAAVGEVINAPCIGGNCPTGGCPGGNCPAPTTWRRR